MMYKRTQSLPRMSMRGGLNALMLFVLMPGILLPAAPALQKNNTLAPLSSPALMPGGMPSPNFGPGGMPMPTEEELEEALKFIASLPPEELAALERFGQQMINDMDDETLGFWSEQFNIAPDVLRDEARKGLDEAAPEAPVAATPDAAPKTPEKSSATTPQIPSKTDAQQAKNLVQSILNHLSSLQQKSASVQEVYELIRQWSQELRELMFYLHVISAKEHYERLALPNFKKTYQSLQTLCKTLKLEEPRIVLPDELTYEETPYDLLGIKQGSSEKKIETAFTKLSQQRDPIALEKKLKEMGATESDIKRQVKSAKLAQEALEDAYEQLSDPKMREQIDREIEAQKKQHKQAIEQAKSAINSITAQLGTTVYDQQLLRDLENFLQQYAPEQLKQKQALDAAEKKYQEDQKRLAQLSPSQTSGSFEPRVQLPQSSGNDYGYGRDFYPYDYNNNYNYPDYSYGSYPSYERDEDQAKGGKQSDQKGVEKQDSKIAGEKEPNKEAAPKPTERQKEAEKIDKRSPAELMKDLTTEVGAFSSVYPAAKNTLDDFVGYMHKTVKTNVQKKKETKEQVQEKTKELLEEPKKSPEEPKKSLLTDDAEDYSASFNNLFAEEDTEKSPHKAPQNMSKKMSQKNTQEQQSDLYETVTEDRPTPVEANRTAQLEDFYRRSRLKELGDDMQKLLQKVRALGTLSDTDYVEWKKLQKIIDAQEGSFADLHASLEKAAENAPEAKMKAHEKIFNSMRDSLGKLISNYTALKNR